jgi:hypothetical protein
MGAKSTVPGATSGTAQPNGTWSGVEAERRRDGLHPGDKVVLTSHPTWTSVGAVLQAFFAPHDVGERLWIFSETDSYTDIVRRWSAVTSEVAVLIRDVIARRSTWRQHHMTQPGWLPRFGYAPPSGHGWNRLVAHPPNTDPETAKRNFVLYLTTAYATEELHTSSIGSFRLMATADEIDLSTRKVILNVWMYNEMSKRSFGRFATEWPFANLPMRSQFMWWNWKEKFNFDKWGNVEPWRGNLRY